MCVLFSGKKNHAYRKLDWLKSFYLFITHKRVSSCADQEGGVRPLKNHKNIGFRSNTGPDSL